MRLFLILIGIAIYSTVFFLQGCATIPAESPGMENVSENIYCQHTNDPLVRVFHVKCEGAHGQPGQLLVYTLVQVPGVQNIDPVPYQFTVRISPLFEWSEIEPQIIEIISKFIGVYSDAVEDAPEESNPEQEVL
jgi:hypothetical protein